MKALYTLCAAFCLLLAACGGPTLMGENAPEYGAPKGGQLDSALACAVDLAISGGDPTLRVTDALPNEVKGGEASQAALNKLQDGGSNSWRGQNTFYSLTAGPVFKWRDRPIRSVRVRMQAADGVKEWSGLAVRDRQNVWIFVDLAQRWTNADTLAFYKGIDRPGDGQNHSWTGEAGSYSLVIQKTDLRGNIVVRNFALHIGEVTMEGTVSREAKKAWQLEDAR